MKFKYVFASLICFCLFSCDQVVTRGYGGTTNITLPKNKKLVVATWKETNIWYLIRPMRDSENPEVYEFIESSTYGMMEGKVIFHESKQ